jgi:hypothetical protein
VASHAEAAVFIAVTTALYRVPKLVRLTQYVRLPAVAAAQRSSRPPTRFTAKPCSTTDNAGSAASATDARYASYASRIASSFSISSSPLTTCVLVSGS